MENFSYHVPTYIVTGGVATSGHSSTITAGQISLIDRQTWSVATAAGNGKEFFFAQGAIGGFDWNGNAVTDTHKSPYFFAKNVTNMYKSLPSRLVNEEWVIGYDGSASSQGFTFTAGKTTRLKFIFSGDPIYRKFGGPKEYQVSYTVPVDCTDPLCVADCTTTTLDCKPHTMKLIDLINNHIELKQFGVQAKLVTDTYVAGTPTYTNYHLSVCDTGDAIALQKVQAQIGSGSLVTRTGRSGSTSSYQICRLTTTGLPSAFTQAGAIELAVCDVCPTGTTFAAGSSEWIVSRPLAGTEDLDDSTARQTFSDAIGTQYETATKRTFDATDAAVVILATEKLVFAAHEYETGDRVTYTHGGGTAIGGLTTATDYYVIKVDENNIQLATTLALAYAGTEIALSAGAVGTTHTLTPVITATFLANLSSVAQVKLVTGRRMTLTATLSDVVVAGAVKGAKCSYADASTIAWTAGDTGMASSRTLKTKLKRPDCNASGDRLVELTALVALYPTLSALTKIAGDGCVDEYTVVQASIDCLPEGCLTENVTFTYETIPSLDNAIWEVVEASEVENLTRTCGIRVTAGYIDPKFGDCSFDPKDYYNDEPVRFELAVFDEAADGCTYDSLPTVFRSRVGTIQRQTGEYIIREVLQKNEAYLRHVKQWDMDNRTREAFDMNTFAMVDRKAFYVLYYVSFNDSYHMMDRKAESEKFTAVFAFKETDATQFNFETGPIAILSGKSGVPLHVNS